MMFIILEHTNIHVYEPYVTEWHAQRQDISPLGGLNLPVVELWPWDHETFLDFSPNFNHL